MMKQLTKMYGTPERRLRRMGGGMGGGMNGEADELDGMEIDVLDEIDEIYALRNVE
jgi:hypothetical protein